ncbi:MAG: ABC transporter permease [Planctomycetes bacterium]|nr:ABC transporter permease [Planctomycetota bacterium]
MSVIWAICRRDLVAAFTTPLAWLVLACWTMLVDLTFWLTLSRVHGGPGSDTPLFVESLSSGVFYLILLAPAITMNSFSLERVHGTMQLLMTVPIREHQLVVGKFLSAFLMLATLVAATAVQPVILSFISSVPGPQLASGYLGLLSASALFAALGVWISLLVDSPVAAYVITFAVIAVLMLVGFVGHEGVLGRISETLGLWPRAMPFFRGEVRLGNIAYFAGAAVAFLVLAHSVLTARRLHG